MDPLHPEVAKLSGGDRRSIGRSEEVVADVLADPTLFDLIFDAITSDDPLIRMRAADAVEKITAERPDLLRPHKRRLLTDLAAIPQQEVRWHVAQMLPRLSLSASDRRQVADIVESYLDDRSGIVRTCAMQALAEVAVDDAELRARVVPLLRRLTRDGTPAMRARGRRLLAELDPSSVSAAPSPSARRTRSARNRSDARKPP
jgi:HEAT repeat protein